jgi:hypothetical protein
MTIFWIIWGFNVLACLVPIYFFFWGLTDGTVDENNILIWLLIFTAIGISILGSYAAYSSHHLKLAIALCQIITIPACLALFYFLLIFITKPKWN